MFLLSCFLKHLFRLEKHYTVFWSSTGILLLDDKLRIEVKSQLISLLDCCRTPLVLQISPAAAINDPDF